MAASKLSIVMFPGAFHSSDVFKNIQALLEAQSYSCLLSANAPSLDSEDPLVVDLATDVKFFRNQVILPLLQNGKDIIIVVHSLAGATVGGAVKELSKQERQKGGLDGGIIGIIVIAALCLPAGLSTQEFLQMPDTLSPWMIVDEKKGTITAGTVEIAAQLFYNQLPAIEAEKYASRLLPHALKTFKTKAEYEPWTDPAYAGKCAYLLCENDLVLPLETQQAWSQLDNFKFTQIIPTSHSPFLDMPERTVEILIEWVQEFCK